MVWEPQLPGLQFQGLKVSKVISGLHQTSGDLLCFAECCVSSQQQADLEASWRGTWHGFHLLQSCHLTWAWVPSGLWGALIHQKQNPEQLLHCLWGRKIRQYSSLFCKLLPEICNRISFFICKMIRIDQTFLTLKPNSDFQWEFREASWMSHSWSNGAVFFYLFFEVKD